MLRKLKRWWVRDPAEEERRLLRALAETPGDYREVTGLADAAGLGATAYPLLTELSRRGWVEHGWLETPGGPRLAYRLTRAGTARLSDAPGDGRARA